nr:MAG TPA: hypothetical protein [Caudoviricetes sp.]
MLPMFSVPDKQLMMKKLLKALAILPYIASSCSTWWKAISRLQKKQRSMTMNNKEASINKVDELVNRAQLAINDWQCSGDGDYVHKAYANLQQAAIRLTLSRQAVNPKKSELMYSVIGDALAADYENLDLYDTTEEALKEAKDFLKAGDIVTVLEMAESDWQPYICIDSLLEEFQDQAFF